MAGWGLAMVTFRDLEEDFALAVALDRMSSMVSLVQTVNERLIVNAKRQTTEEPMVSNRSCFRRTSRLLLRSAMPNWVIHQRRQWIGFRAMMKAQQASAIARMAETPMEVSRLECGVSEIARNMIGGF
jgi:hypothetical protein